MKSAIRRFAAMSVLALPLVAALTLNACESPVAPRFPDPVEDEDTITNDDEGATGRRAMGSMTAAERDSVMRRVFIPCAENRTCR